MKGFRFVNNAAEREFLALPREIKSEFGLSLRAIQTTLSARGLILLTNDDMWVVSMA